MGVAIVFTIIGIAMGLIWTIAIEKGILYKLGALGFTAMFSVYSFIVALVLSNFVAKIVAESLYTNYIMVEYLDILLYSIVLLFNACLSLIGIITGTIIKVVNMLTSTLGVTTKRRIRIFDFILLFILGVVPEAVAGYFYLYNGENSLEQVYAATLIWCFMMTFITIGANSSFIFKTITGNIK